MAKQYLSNNICLTDENIFEREGGGDYLLAMYNRGFNDLESREYGLIELPTENRLLCKIYLIKYLSASIKNCIE